MQEVLAAFPGAQRALMRRYHIGGCGRCGFTPQERLGDVLKRHGSLDAQEVLRHLAESDEQDRRLQIQPRELAALIARDPGVRLLDVRTPEEQDIVMIKGGLRVTQELVGDILSNWPKETPMVTVCHHGVRSLDAASYLIGHGFQNVRSLEGGIDAWAAEVDPALPRY
jgi:rhodanese-related sulfurtransferase